MAGSSSVAMSLSMAFAIGAGTAGLLSSCNLITQIGAPQVMRGRMAGLSQIAFLGGGGISGLLAVLLVAITSKTATFALTGGIGAVLALLWIRRRGGTVLEPLRSA